MWAFSLEVLAHLGLPLHLSMASPVLRCRDCLCVLGALIAIKSEFHVTPGSMLAQSTLCCHLGCRNQEGISLHYSLGVCTSESIVPDFLRLTPRALTLEFESLCKLQL